MASRLQQLLHYWPGTTKAENDRQPSSSSSTVVQIDESQSDDVLHRDGLRHLQAGEWENATEYLSELVARHPDREYYADLLEQAQVRARLDERPPQRQTGESVLQSRWVWILALVNLLVWGFIFGRQLYQQQIAPVLQQRERVTRQQQLLAEGRQLLAEGELDEAKARFQEVLTLDADNAAAQRTLEEINRRQELNQAYETALMHIEQREWQAALEELEWIRRQEPGFRDVQARIAAVQQSTTFGGRLSGARQSVGSGEWQAAIDQLQLLRQEAPDFQPETVRALLARAYLGQAEAGLSDLGEGSLQADITALQAAIEPLNNATEADPSNTQAATQAEAAQEYLAGLEAYQQESWEAAGFHLANVFTLQSDYAGGRAATLLQNAYLESGNRYLRMGKHQRAAERYRQTIALRLIEDEASTLPEEAQRQLENADQLVRQERFGEAILAYGEILGTMGFGETAGTIDQLVEEQQPAAGSDAAGSTTYTVQPNDTLSRIAQQFDTTVAAIIEANDMIWDKNLIRPGWQLTIPER